MKVASVLAVAILVLLVLMVGYSFYSYLSDAHRLPPDLETRQDWKEAVSEVRHYRYYEPLACFVLLATFSFLLAIAKLPRISWLRSTLAGLLTTASVYAGFYFVMNRDLRERDASFGLPPGAVWDTLVFALGGVVAAGTILFVIERVYVGRIAPNA